MLIDFEGTMADELTVKTGDVVRNVTKASEEGWLEGELAGKKGIFPATFAKVSTTIQSMHRNCPPSLRVFTHVCSKICHPSRRCQSI